MTSVDYYGVLGVSKNASETEIKRAFRKKAMQWHPDKNKNDAQAEKKFKEINEAYQVLSDSKKKQQYDTFGSADGPSFGGGGGGYQQAGGFDFQDIFSQFGGGSKKSAGNAFEFDLGDLFGGGAAGGSAHGGAKKQKASPPPEEPSRDVSIKEEIHIFDFLLGTKISVSSVYGDRFKLTIPAGTQPGTKFKVQGKGRTIDGKTGDLYVIVQAKMPKNIPENIKKFLEDIKHQL